MVFSPLPPVTAIILGAPCQSPGLTGLDLLRTPEKVFSSPHHAATSTRTNPHTVTIRNFSPKSLIPASHVDHTFHPPTLHEIPPPGCLTAISHPKWPKQRSQKHTHVFKHCNSKCWQQKASFTYGQFGGLDEVVDEVTGVWDSDIITGSLIFLNEGIPSTQV